MDRLLVTGGAGFIGSNFIRYLIENTPYWITNLDKLTYSGNLDNLKDVEREKRYHFIKGDVCDKADVEEASRDIECIVNFASETHVDRSILEAEVFLETNIKGTHRLLEAARKKDLRFIQISTDEVYGSLTEGSFLESDRLDPSSPYSASKAAADMLVNAYFTTYGLDVIVTRSSNNYGSYQYPEKMIPLFITNILKGHPLPLYGDGLNIRDWLYVEDNCRGILALMEKGERGEVYNIASGEEKKNWEVATIILKLADKPLDLIQYVGDRLGHDRRYSLNCDKIKKLGWTPQVLFDEGIVKTFKWYRENEWWWRPLKRVS